MTNLCNMRRRDCYNSVGGKAAIEATSWKRDDLVARSDLGFSRRHRTRLQFVQVREACTHGAQRAKELRLVAAVLATGELEPGELEEESCVGLRG